MAASIREHGVINPIIVEAIDRQHCRILSGERRYRVSVEAGLTVIPCIVRTVEEHNRLAFQLIENLHRKDLNPLEEAKSYRRLMDEFKPPGQGISPKIKR